MGTWEDARVAATPTWSDGENKKPISRLLVKKWPSHTHLGCYGSDQQDKHKEKFM
jgi:hypothetical protein